MKADQERIPNCRLTKSDVPAGNCPWRTIALFALSFNGYEEIPNDGCGKLTNRVTQEFRKDPASLRRYNLTELRACLFFEQRRFHHYGWNPGPDDMTCIRALVGAVRNMARGVITRGRLHLAPTAMLTHTLKREFEPVLH
jgi:hypothetical protein